MSRPLVGVLALQGDVADHRRKLEQVGAATIRVRRETELRQCDGLVLPGGESTTIAKLLRAFDLLEPLQARIRDGMPVFGTCAGMILLADRVLDGTDDQETVGGLDVTVRRNAFGRQVASFESDLAFTGLDEAVPATFIRAPWVEQVGPGVETLATSAEGHAVAVRSGALLATSFHPEVGADTRVHDLFVSTILP